MTLISSRTFTEKMLRQPPPASWDEVPRMTPRFDESDLEEAVWVESLHRRNRLGRWVDMFGDLLRGPSTTVGATPYLRSRSAERRQSPPGDYRKAQKLPEHPKWQALFESFESDAEKLADEHGVKLVKGERNVGAFEGAWEPSYSLKVCCDPDKISEYEKDLGAKYGQKAVVAFRPDPDGPDVELRMPAGDDPDGFFKAVTKVMGDDAGITMSNNEWRLFVGGFLDDPEAVIKGIGEVAAKRGLPMTTYAGYGEYHQLREGEG